MVQALLFDFDGVVVDTEVPTFESWRQIYREYRVDLELSDWLPVVGAGSSTGTDAVFDAVAHLEALTGRTLDRVAVVAARTELKRELCDRAELLPGVVEYLAEARRLELKTAIVTRAAASWVEHHLARVGLAHRWDAVVAGDGLGGKPKSSFYATRWSGSASRAARRSRSRILRTASKRRRKPVSGVSRFQIGLRAGRRSKPQICSSARSWSGL